MVDGLQLERSFLGRTPTLHVEVFTDQVFDANLLRILAHVVPEHARRKLPLALVKVE